MSDLVGWGRWGARVGLRAGPRGEALKALAAVMGFAAARSLAANVANPSNTGASNAPVFEGLAGFSTVGKPGLGPTRH